MPQSRRPHKSRSGSTKARKTTERRQRSSISPEPTLPSKASKRTATVYDAVAGRIGLNGFLTTEQLESNDLLPSKPEEVLLRRVGAPDTVTYDYYHSDERLGEDQVLPDTDLLKAIHAYTSDYYAATTEDGGQVDFRSFDETALLGLGILLEEASKEVLGENGDMVLVEPEGIEHRLPASKMARYQVVGKVKPRVLQVQQEENKDDGRSGSDDLALEASPRKKRR